MRNFLTKQRPFAPAPILIFPVRGRSRVRSRISCVYTCYFKALNFYPWRWTFGTLSARDNTENNSRVYVLLRESARERERPQVCARVHSNRNGLTGENTFAFATGVYYNVVFKSSKWFRTCPEMPTAYITCIEKGAVENSWNGNTIFPRNDFPSCHPLISVKTRELLVRDNIINANYICVTTPKNRSVLGLTLVRQQKYRTGWTKT
jgi:hypothetical protein